MGSGTPRGSFARHPILLIMLAGLLITVLRVRDRVPFHPLDLMSYVGGYYANRDGGDAYDIDDSRASLAARGMAVEPSPLLYPPPFLMTMLPLEVVPYRWFRLGWIGAGAVSAWLAVFILSKRLRKPGALVFTAGALLFLTVSQTLYDAIVCGQVTSFMLLALALVLCQGFSGIRAGIAAVVLTLQKVCFLPLALFIKGRRAAVSCLLLVALLSGVSALVFGQGTFPAWTHWMKRTGMTWGFREVNNLSITNAVEMITDGALSPQDRARAMEDHSFRVALARNTREVSVAVYASLAMIAGLSAAFLLLRERGKLCSPDRERVLSVAVLYLLVFMPCVWIHYGLFIVFPLRELCARGRFTAAGWFLASALVWGAPLGALPSWPRFLVPLGWMIYMVLRRECPRSMSSLEAPVFTAEAGKNSRDPQGRRSEAGAAEVR